MSEINRQHTGDRRAWLAGLLLRRGDVLLPRFARLYAALARRPRGWRRQLRHQLAVTVTGAALLLAMAGAGAGYAGRADADNVITVVNGEVKIANNGKCSLSEAIRNANNQNTGQSHADCATGNPLGADMIVLPQNGVFTLTTAHNTSDEYGPNGLPWFGSTITVEGNGATIQRMGTEEKFRIMAVGPNGNLTLKDTIIKGGETYYYDESRDADHGGGGILNLGSLTITGSTIAENYSYIYWRGHGGGIDNHGDLTITGSIVHDNKAGGYGRAEGGGIYNHKEGKLTIMNSRVSGNLSLTGYMYGTAFGGGLTDIGGTTTILDSVFSENVAESWYMAFGGGVDLNGETFIDSSLFTYNKAIKESEYFYEDLVGGAIINFGKLTITNSTLSGNESDGYGGGLANFSEVTMTNNTIIGNLGGGISTTCEFVSTQIIVQRSIISGNIGGEMAQKNIEYCPQDYGVAVNSHNIFGRNNNAGVSGFNIGQTDIVPSGGLNSIVSLLADNGGPTWTHALPPGSPAIDRAPNNTCTAAPVSGVDQRGFPRNANGSGGTSANECDIGAFELQPVEPSPTPTQTATATATPTATPPPTQTTTASPSPTPTDGPSPTPTTTPTVSPTPTDGPSPTPTATTVSSPFEYLLFLPMTVDQQ